MEIDLKELKRIVDETILTEAKCAQIIHELLTKENEALHNSVLGKIITVLARWTDAPLVENLKELKSIERPCFDGNVGANMTDADDKVVGIEEMAEILNVPTNWLYQRTRSGKIPCFKVGKYVKFNVKKVMQFYERKAGLNNGTR